MLIINKRLNKLAVMRVYFHVCGMLAGTWFDPPLPIDRPPSEEQHRKDDEDNDGSDVDVPDVIFLERLHWPRCHVCDSLALE